MTESLRITEIFYSLQGEARTAGRPTTFVRLTGCPLRCQYCDTEYAFHGGEQLALDDIVTQIDSHPTRRVTVTGGEPLAQPLCIDLLKRLCDQQFNVSLETSGALDTSRVDPRVSVVLDLKTPGSGEVSKNLYANLAHLSRHDQVKFVICDRADYEWARFKVAEHSLIERVEDVLFSASHGQLASEALGNWILEDGLDVRLQMQLHKLLWGDKPGV